MQKYMVIEWIKVGCWDAAYTRFHEQGRFLPPGLNYLNSWPNKEISVCYQLMETSNPELLELWISHWDDLTDFEVVPID